ncbi:ead/Ea22-like family protein [Salmonella enterica subsp. enterica serovar Schwarzengrund]|uniref:Ead/Ea22-like family protein n=2 Tax=Salmonella enterica I TaxID=59201 RepID=A0A3V9PSU3_SALET|nr:MULTISPECIES: ead/Ea22-like family protein [Salmonella]EAA9731931.1 ead/Ea22-like family protein [Salmonella enterica subsp. enterica]EBV7395854.1 ead/Ea22-like family protein [Salmonella enterica subsp. enterica serovar Blockley]MCL9286144.1 ead/Ea22-like family protein [Salmonella enterica subsp. enterica serovar Enteritidis]EAA9446572.1 ead/Ea22-like family protein [Salmonella enterica subsp. enterica serovar Bredeney]EAA9824843.1 ead/Ea22-like family protein [Salmonella enterica subsp. 
MTKINYQALREKAEKATCGVWSLEYGEEKLDAGDALIHREVVGYLPICIIEGAHPESGFDEDFQMEQQANAEFIAAANPATVLALLDELEHYKSREERVTKLVLDNSTSWDALYKKLEAAEKRIAELDKRLIEYAGIATREAHRVAELEARTVILPEPIIVLHRRDFTDAHREIYAYPEAEVNAALADAVIGVNGE